ncbi:MAG: hypothetical protein HY054_03365 [Proteobacteria bacterium]|nr:hypothetical protein [Pseudomonadota bacterium]
MNTFITGIEDLVALVGQNWVVAVCAAFVVMIFESAKPHPVEGQDEPRASALQRVAIIASLAVPFLLFLHAFGAFILAHQQAGQVSERDGGIILALIAGAILFVVAPGIIGWVIAQGSPTLAGLLQRAAPVLALLVFVFTVYVTYRNAFFVLNLYVLSHMR